MCKAKKIITDSNENTYTIKEASIELNVTYSTIWSWVNKNKITSLEELRFRSTPEGKAQYAEYGKSSSAEKKLNFNRTKTCFRNKGTERCITYRQRLEMDMGQPEPCLSAIKDTCPNYNGEKLEPIQIKENLPAKYYSPNNTGKQLL